MAISRGPMRLSRTIKPAGRRPVMPDRRDA